MATSTFIFTAYEADFNKDTGLDARSNLDQYLAYCQLRNIVNLNINFVSGINSLYNKIRADLNLPKG